MAGGALAGEAGLRWLAGAAIGEAQDVYEGGWRRRFGDFVERSLAARRQLDRASDADLNAAARALGESRRPRSVGHSIMELATAAEAHGRAYGLEPPLSAASR
jgi:hypothetical protein